MANILSREKQVRIISALVEDAGKRARLEEKPEVRKAGGVYYTPEYIVRYIVENTVGKLIAGKTPKQIADMRFADIACGSGSFLLGVFDLLINYHGRYYNENPSKARKGDCIKRDGRLFLSLQKKREILLNNIFGVDIDPQAVEVTKLSLLLRVLEGEKNLVLFHNERALPDLAGNIKCGNSLIGPDFYTGQQLAMFDEDERFRINAFDWPAEFPEVFKEGGFDAVIGNPPYIRMESFKELKDYLRSHYTSHEERSDLYAYFIEHAHNVLRQNGRFGMIVSNKFLRANYGRPLRDLLRVRANIERVVNFAGLPVFTGATIRTVVLLSRKETGQLQPTIYSPPVSYEDFQSIVAGSQSVEDIVDKSSYVIPPASLARDVWSFGEPEAEDLLERLSECSVALSVYCAGRICRGVVSGCTEAFVIDGSTRAAILRQNQKAHEIIKPLLNGRDIRRYWIALPDAYLIYTYHGIDMTEYRAILDHLLPFKARLQRRATKQQWYELQQPQFKFTKFMEAPKIIFPDIATTPRFALDESGCYGTNTTYFIPLRDMFLLGLLNSSLARFYFTRTCAGLEGKSGTYLRFFGQYLEDFPVCAPKTSARSPKAGYDRMVELVEEMLGLRRDFAKAMTPTEKATLERQMAATDAQIDQLVYELYGLTDDEIRIVEEATRTS